ncbi:voltage-dependent calcium channel subunit alpha-2/delta-3-like isoform X2 [Diabrotica undecimpunctata]|uniref:voltage-dependent calcium channel subunit alpha-2/delta-3-like isoform X2 n=1 Tax=Diabrotica undecimpunctata TaxID=50387 RepID=UPI003B632DD7
MTSVSLPVYDKKPRQERVANLLGVAGTDIPIEYIQRLMIPYRLGVNGYAFIVTNNGYVLTHPDLRPVYQGILKPAYNRVDMIEIEIIDDDSDARNFSDKIRDFRRHVVMQNTGNITLDVKSHLDDMRRITFMTRDYYYRGINGTPFSLVISLPKKYGYARVEPKVENDIHRLTLSQPPDKKPLLRYFAGIGPFTLTGIIVDIETIRNILITPKKSWSSFFK